MSKRHDPIAAQELAATPYGPENSASLRRAMRPPRHTREYLSWFLGGWELETPDAIHSGGVWTGPQQNLDDGTPRWPAELTGGSALGAPKLDDGFRRLLENSPKETDRQDDAYVRPMRAALVELRHSSPFMADALAKLANGATIEEAVAGFTRDAPHLVAEIVIGESLRRLHAKYRVEPEPRTIRTETPAKEVA